MRTVCMALAGVLLATPAARAGDKGLTGNWKITFFERGASVTPWLLTLTQKDGKLEGSLKTAPKVPESSVSKVQLKGKLLSFTVKLGGFRVFSFEFPVPKGKLRVLMGSMQLGPSQILPARLEATTEKTVELKQTPPPEPPSYEKAKELIGKAAENPSGFDAAGILFRKAKENKASAKEVQGWTDTLLKAASHYGPRLQRELTLRLAQALASSGDYPKVAEEVARKAVKDLGPNAEAEAEMRVLGVLETALEKAGKTAEAKKLAERIGKLEEKGHKENLAKLPFTPEKAAAPKGNHAVLVELFTGAMCPPCVAADLAFDGLEITYSPKAVVLLQYHLHIPGPDALTNPASVARSRYYKEDLQGTPTIFFNGKSEAGGGGPRGAAGAKYKEYRSVIKPLLSEKAKATIKAEAVRKGDKIEITANVSDLAKPGEKVKLRLALVQEWARYPGGNGLSYHSRVVRAMPGGPEGFALTKAASKHTASVDLGDLRKELKKYIEMRKYPTTVVPLKLRDLHVVAFVQNDETHTVLQAVEVAIKGE